MKGLNIKEAVLFSETHSTLSYFQFWLRAKLKNWLKKPLQMNRQALYRTEVFE